MHTSIAHIETVFGHALSTLSERLEVRQTLKLEVLPENSRGPGYYHFDKASGVFTMSEDIFKQDPHVPWYAIARLVGMVSHEENPVSGKTFVIDGAVELPELRAFEQSLLQDGEEGIIHSRFLRSYKPEEPQGEVCSKEEALKLVGGGFVNRMYEPPGSGRGSVSYQWKDDGQFMIRSESTMTRDADGKYHFTDTEYRKIRRN